MSFNTLIQLFSLMLSSFVVAILAIYALSWLDRKRNGGGGNVMEDARDQIAFLFDDEELVNASPAAQALIGGALQDQTEWSQLSEILQPHFPNIRAEIANLAERGIVRLESGSGNARLTGRWKNGLASISLFDFETAQSNITLNKPSYEALQNELLTLRCTAATAAVLVWRQTKSGEIVWANQSYLTLANTPKIRNGPVTWPPRQIFDLAHSDSVAAAHASKRISTTIPGEADKRWFECFEAKIGDDQLFTAVAADKMVKAEKALNDFVQTLTKTFAHLEIGLAIFDKQRKLALFNPALTDLTSLKPGFLSGRPSLQAVLNQLRDNQVLPEPKDYKSWRRRLHELEVAAVNGSYEETWSLPNGRTYRVTGRPHPDGALAFLMEDISAEISLTRRFRAELDIGQAVIDSLPEAISVFSPTGALTLSNSAYCRLWGIANDSLGMATDIASASSMWSEKCMPTNVWGDAREFAGSFSDRSEWSATVTLKSGGTLTCRLTPISGGATIVGFSNPAQINGSLGQAVGQTATNLTTRPALG